MTLTSPPAWISVAPPTVNVTPDTLNKMEYAVSTSIFIHYILYYFL